MSKKELIELSLLEISNVASPDVLCFTETFVKTGEEKYVNISNYELATSYCRKKKKGGACILVKKGLAFKKIDCFDDLTLIFDFECCAIQETTNNIFIICIYSIEAQQKIRNELNASLKDSN